MVILYCLLLPLNMTTLISTVNIPSQPKKATKLQKRHVEFQKSYYVYPKYFSILRSTQSQ